MSQYLTTQQLFGEHSYFFLPDFLNTMGVTAEQFGKLRIMNKPHLVKALMYHFRQHEMVRPTCALNIRRYRMTGNDLDDVGALLKLAEVDPRDSSAIATSASCFRIMVEGIMKRSSIYDRVLPGAEKSVVQSAVVGTFSYTGTDYDAELQSYSLVTCPCCHTEDTVYDGDEADNAAVEASFKFQYLSGPYARCNDCGRVVRPTVSPAVGLPLEAAVDQNDGDEWDWYKGNLQDLIDTMCDRVTRHTGFPIPHQLHVEVQNANWRGSSAWVNTDLSGDSLATAMSVNGDFHIVDGKLIIQADDTASLCCLMPHHDATSAITVTPIWNCQIDPEVWINQDEMKDAEELAKVAETLLCGSNNAYEYSSSRHRADKFTLVSRSALAEGIRELMTRLGYGSKPWDMEKMLEEPGDSPALDLIAYNLFTLEDLILIKKQPVSIVAFHAELVSRALNDYLTLEESDAT